MVPVPVFGTGFGSKNWTRNPVPRNGIFPVPWSGFLHYSGAVFLTSIWGGGKLIILAPGRIHPGPYQTYRFGRLGGHLHCRCHHPIGNLLPKLDIAAFPKPQKELPIQGHGEIGWCRKLESFPPSSEIKELETILATSATRGANCELEYITHTHGFNPYRLVAPFFCCDKPNTQCKLQHIYVRSHRVESSSYVGCHIGYSTG